MSSLNTACLCLLVQRDRTESKQIQFNKNCNIISVLEKLIRDYEIHFAVVHVIENFLF